ncbi:related to GNAT family N-acetyltransferase [Cephalotrichum gorgonifer]|uniref:Related to GNAT family N-acetyltransferase n=1 Tax=Cephalotrichum gorgonifer TaxID=2041049 RepID=A0AAE8MTM6_9PEZI|nr:related to GNAT family N-acetyltransferase [Cephalotrichum gorgonifer]
MEANGAKPYIIRNHRPGDMGLITHRHGVLYAKELNWPPRFEAWVGRITADFIETYDAASERCWIAERKADGAFLGCVILAKDRENAGVAKLRTLLVEEDARGMGLGGELVRGCVTFAREVGYEKVSLLTAEVLGSARRLYKNEGFELVSAEEINSFGKAVVQEAWELKL